MSGGGQVHIDVLVLTALLDELDAVLDLGEGGRRGWAEAVDPAGLPYHVRAIPRPAGRPLALAAAWSGNMGEVAAADRARALAEHLAPRWLAMCGICAGRRGAVSLGDVIVADRVFSYDHGKLIASTGPDGQRQEEIFRDITTYNLRDPWFTKVAYFVRDLAWSAELAARRPVSLEQQSRWLLRALLGGEDPMSHPARAAECPDWRRLLQYLERRGLIAYEGPAVRLTEPGHAAAQRDRIESPDAPPRDPPFRVHLGPIATGKTVRVDPEIFDRIRQFSRNAIGIEMEAAAIGYVAERLGVPSLIAKAVSDHADQDKDDGFRAFACRASARFVLEFLLRQDLDDAAPSGGTFYREGPAVLGAKRRHRLRGPCRAGAAGRSRCCVAKDDRHGDGAAACAVTAPSPTSAGHGALGTRRGRRPRPVAPDPAARTGRHGDRVCGGARRDGEDRRGQDPAPGARGECGDRPAVPQRGPRRGADQAPRRHRHLRLQDTR
jgi:nucleoside phosphorylase